MRWQHLLVVMLTINGKRDIWNRCSCKEKWHRWVSVCNSPSSGAVIPRHLYKPGDRDSVAGIRTRYSWTARGSNPGGDNIFPTRPDKPWGPHSFLYNRRRVSFQGLKRPGRDGKQPSPSSAEVEERVELNSIPSLCLHGRLQGGLLPLIFYINLSFTATSERTQH
jgi:hypothetical protein